MYSIFSPTYLSRRPVEKATQDFARRFTPDMRVLDIGCGKKPYAHFFSCEYIGIDPLDIVHPDIVAPAWSIPVADNSFDGIILNQSLEHIQNTQGTISEIKRILKPDGVCIITVPHTMKNHSEPIAIAKSPLAGKIESEMLTYWQEDYYRFTKFGLVALFQDFKIETLRETSGYIGTLLQLVNYFFASFGRIRVIFTPLFFLNNCLGCGLDTLFFTLSKSKIPFFKKFYDLIYSSLPLNYILIIKKP